MTMGEGLVKGNAFAVTRATALPVPQLFGSKLLESLPPARAIRALDCLTTPVMLMSVNGAITHLTPAASRLLNELPHSESVLSAIRENLHLFKGDTEPKKTLKAIVGSRTFDLVMNHNPSGEAVLVTFIETTSVTVLQSKLDGQINLLELSLLEMMGPLNAVDKKINIVIASLTLPPAVLEALLIEARTELERLNQIAGNLFDMRRNELFNSSGETTISSPISTENPGMVTDILARPPPIHLPSFILPAIPAKTHFIDCLEIPILVLSSSGVASYANPAANSLLAVPAVSEAILTSIMANIGFLNETADHKQITIKVTADSRTFDLVLNYDCHEQNISAELIETTSITCIKAEVERRTDTINQFLHDIRTPMSSALLIVETNRRVLASLAEGALIPSTLEAKLNRVLVMIARINGMMERLTVSRYDELFDPSVEINEVAHVLSERASRFNVKSTFSSDNLPCQLFGDRHEFFRALINLGTNAINAMNDDQRDVAKVLTFSVNLVDDEFLSVAMADTGPGIPTEIQTRIFEPGFTTRRENGGTGLGLGATKRILEEEFGGQLMLNTTVGMGTTFNCKIPIKTPK